ncbi:Lrp/AsnC family transcriptional regulator [Pseudohalocynthiibacter aestuariivivens]|nr:Lrp/AsnC family transcriptional regulator [Pseudohalocynthiibacter aestuariivivens]
MNQKIIRLLQQDGRMAFSEIAQLLDVSEGTIRNRVSGLRDNNMLHIVALADPVVNEYSTDAIIGVNVAPGVTPAEIAAQLQDDYRVVFILWVAGTFDLVVEIVSDDHEVLKDFLEEKIYPNPGIAKADVMVGLKNLKNQFLLKHDWPDQSSS